MYRASMRRTAAVCVLQRSGLRTCAFFIVVACVVLPCGVAYTTLDFLFDVIPRTILRGKDASPFGSGPQLLGPSGFERKNDDVLTELLENLEVNEYKLYITGKQHSSNQPGRIFR